MTQNQLILLSFVGEAIFWLGAYILIIRIAFKQKIHAMPVVAMCGNISWELILGLGLFPACPVYWEACPAWFLQIGTFAAALLDGVIFYTILRYGRSQFTLVQFGRNKCAINHANCQTVKGQRGTAYSHTSSYRAVLPWLHRYYYGIVLFGVGTAFSINYGIMSEMFTLNIFQASVKGTVPQYLQVGLQGGIYTGWGLALMMGILFIVMNASRSKMAGQSFYIALFMFLGNLFAFFFDIFAMNQIPSLLLFLVVPALVINLIYVISAYSQQFAPVAI